MAKIEDYAVIGDLQTCALVCSNGSIDWLCIPRFDSAACFAALLGDDSNGRWVLRPVEPVISQSRRYRGETMVLETTYETASGTVRIVDFMPPRDQAPDVVRIVEGLSGSVRMHLELTIRFDYGSIVPWVRQTDDALVAVGGPDAICLRTPVETYGENMHTASEFTVSTDDKVPFVLTWFPSHEQPPKVLDPFRALEATTSMWETWIDKCTYKGPWREAVVRSLLTLKALTYEPTGGIVAAPTTSLPEQIGGERNWDYRFCWIRDATLTLFSLLSCGFTEEAGQWRDWLLRAAAGDPAELQIMYGLHGERRLQEWEAPWLSGYEGSKPVRIGNEASQQVQLDVYGEMLDALSSAQRAGLGARKHAWAVERKLVNYVESVWQEKDNGIWEVRGPKRHFTHSKVMAWVAMDRAVRILEQFGGKGNVKRWKATRDAIHADVIANGYSESRGSFTQSYDSDELDASLLMIPIVGFLPASDERVRGTVRAIQNELMTDGFVDRYRTVEGFHEVDGLTGGEGAFLPCSFWLADCLSLDGRVEEAKEIFERLLSVRNDVGLLSEEYERGSRRLVGNFPQAFSHVALVGSALTLAKALGDPEGAHPHPDAG